MHRTQDKQPSALPADQFSTSLSSPKPPAPSLRSRVQHVSNQRGPCEGSRQGGRAGIWAFSASQKIGKRSVDHLQKGAFGCRNQGQKLTGSTPDQRWEGEPRRVDEHRVGTILENRLAGVDNISRSIGSNTSSAPRRQQAGSTPAAAGGMRRFAGSGDAGAARVGRAGYSSVLAGQTGGVLPRSVPSAATDKGARRHGQLASAGSGLPELRVGASNSGPTYLQTTFSKSMKERFGHVDQVAGGVPPRRVPSAATDKGARRRRQSASAGGGSPELRVGASNSGPTYLQTTFPKSMKERSGHVDQGAGGVPPRRVPSAATDKGCLLYTSPSPRDRQKSRMPSSA